ncbi:acyltransferase family protein [Rheinheimera sp.]|uniref:acyltransferase family protein n=1 Tax=Rheinheimera sp. TaxID=1869214 RepID=UPI003AF71691
MLGLLRLIFASIVMFMHLFSGLAAYGIYSVFGFYVMSGFLMTRIMHESYGYSWRGMACFLVNRALRLYPVYWVALLFTVLLILGFGSEIVRGYHASMYLPDSLESYLQNIFIAFTAWFPASVNPRLVPPTWAITVEICMYLLIVVGISKTFFRVKVWLIVSLIYVGYTYYVGAPWNARYGPAAAASLPFSVGAATYFLSKNIKLSKFMLRWRLSAGPCFLLLLTNGIFFSCLAPVGQTLISEIGVYLNIIFCALLIFTIANGTQIAPLSISLDQRLGDYAYPIYLMHWQVGLIASYILYGEAFHEYSERGFYSLLLSIPLVIIISTISIHLIEHPLVKARSKIRFMSQGAGIPTKDTAQIPL